MGKELKCEQKTGGDFDLHSCKIKNMLLRRQSGDKKVQLRTFSSLKEVWTKCEVAAGAFPRDNGHRNPRHQSCAADRRQAVSYGPRGSAQHIVYVFPQC